MDFEYESKTNLIYTDGMITYNLRKGKTGW